MTKGSATYKNKKDAEEFAARRKRLGELPVKITQVTVKNANMFDDPMGQKEKEYQRVINQLKQITMMLKLQLKIKMLQRLRKLFLSSRVILKM